MFWKETKGLKELNISSKIAVTAFLIIAGIGYLFGFLNILVTYSPIDQKAGLAIKDIQIAFYGAREQTILEGSIDSTMKEYFQGESDYNAIKEWIASGGTEESFPTVKPIFESSCDMCHSKDAAVAGVVTETYKDVESELAQDTGKSISRLISISHTHILASLPVIFLLFFVFSFTLYGEKFKIIMAYFSFASILLDVGSWWLAKLSPAMAPLVIVGGSTLALTFGILVVLSLWELWIKKT